MEETKFCKSLVNNGSIWLRKVLGDTAAAAFKGYSNEALAVSVAAYEPTPAVKFCTNRECQTRLWLAMRSGEHTGCPTPPDHRPSERRCE